MRRLTYHGPGHRLRLPSGRTVDRDQTGDVTNEDAAAAQADTNVNVTVEDGDDGSDEE